MLYKHNLNKCAIHAYVWIYVCRYSLCKYVCTHTHTYITCYYITGQLMCTSQFVHTSLVSAAPPILLFKIQDLGGTVLARLSTNYIS